MTVSKWKKVLLGSLLCLAVALYPTKGLAEDIPVFKIGDFESYEKTTRLEDWCTAFKIYDHMYLTARHCLANEKGLLNQYIIHSDSQFVEPLSVNFYFDTDNGNTDYALVLSKQEVKDWWTYTLAPDSNTLPEYIFVNGFKGAKDLYIGYQKVVFETDHMFATKGGLFQGMSGSPAINEKREVVGILIAVDFTSDLSYYVKIDKKKIVALIEHTIKQIE